MNSTVKTILLTLLTLSVLTIAMLEVSGVSDKKLSNIFSSEENAETPVGRPAPAANDKQQREEKMRAMDKTMLLIRDSIFNFGGIKEGDKVRHTYVVQNVGDKPLFIANVQTSCGCTAPEFPTEPILPGEQADVTLEFNSKNKKGHQKKNALIICNASNAPYSIGFEAQVD